MSKYSKQWCALIFASVTLMAAGCSSSMKAPATADVAVSNAAVDSAASAGGAEYAPVEMKMSREKMTLARQALAEKDYKKATNLANQAQADAKLAEKKADTGKAKIAAKALQDDIKLLRDDLTRARQVQ